MSDDCTIQPLTLGDYQTNSYLIYREKPGDAIVIDAGADSQDLVAEADALGLTVKHLLLTHGHVDHIAGVQAILDRYQAKLYCLEAELPLLADPNKNLSLYTEKYLKFDKVDQSFADGEVIDLLGFSIKVIHTPGHTAGSGCYLINEKLFAGDTLFAESYGRFDLPTGNSRALVASIRDKLFTLPDSTIVYPGHGPGTTIGNERTHNPIVSLF